VDFKVVEIIRVI